MKKYLLLVCTLILSVVLLPINSYAKEKVVIYFFRGEGCSHCAEAEKFFDGLKNDDEYKDLFEIKDYEVWYNKANDELKNKVADFLGDKVGGVPYIIIGGKSWNGYTSSYGEEMKTQIKATYENDSFVDEIKGVIEGTTTKKNDVVGIVIMVCSVILIGGAIYYARKSEYVTEGEEKKDEKNMESEKIAEKVTEVVEETKSKKTTPKKTTPKKTSPKKTTSKKSTKKSTKKTTKKSSK